jgi:diguanylate cyclase (GGDEF)-like protein/PAS domain S-box-containing protein
MVKSRPTKQRRSEDWYRLLFERNLAGVFQMDPQGRVFDCNAAFGRLFGYASAEDLLAEQPFLQYAGTPAWQSFLDRLHLLRTLPNLEGQTAKKDGSTVWVLANVSWVEEEGQPPLLEGTVIDITERKKAEEGRGAYLRVQAALAEAGTSLLGTLDQDALLSKVLETALGAITAAEKGTIMLWDEASRSLRVAAMSGYSDPRVRDLAFAAPQGYAARVALGREPLIVADALTDPAMRYHGDIDEVREIRSALAAPLIARNELLGVISLDATKPSAFSPDDVALLVTFASQAALAIHNARLYEQMRSSEERFARAFRASPAAMTISTLSDGKYLDVNEAFLQLVGRVREDILGRSSLQLGLWVNAADRTHMVEALASETSLRDMPTQFRRGNEDVRDVLISAETIDLGGEKCVLALSHDVTDRKRAEEQIAHLAYHDALTGLPNRTLFQDRLSQALARTERRGRLLAVLFLDLDRFKLINDTLGHNAGDQLLQQVATRLQSCVRKDDTVARVAGDEFTILLSEISQPEAAGRIAQKLLETIAEPWFVEGRELYVTASVGIALYPADGRDGESLVKSADAAMYRAKDLGRNNYQLCTPGMTTRAMDRMNLETRLRHALERDELVLHYQPFVNLATGAVVGTEALVRWKHPERGLIEPDDFIPLAEDSRLILPVGEWVMRTAATQLKAWQLSISGSLRMAVNLSARQFQQENLPRVVRRILDDAGVAAEFLELEITETVAMQRVGWTAGVLRRLQGMGVHISIDDFGVGQSSLSYLKHFPLSTLKIDRSFVRKLLDDPEDEAIVRAVIALAHSLNLKVIAEGVETESQVAFLKAAGCEEMQGFVFSRPCPADEMEVILKRSLGVQH